MDEETKSNIKIGLIAAVIMAVVFGSLYMYNVAHKADPNHDKEFSNE